MAKKTPLNNPDLAPGHEIAINQLDKLLNDLQSVGKDFKDFKLGEVYLEEEWNEHEPKNVWITQNSMGFPIKYKVVHISNWGIPYLRQLNTNGKPTGGIRLPVTEKAAWLATLMHATTYPQIVQSSRFIPDPEALDSILFEAEYQPMVQQKEKLKLFNEIIKHNKKIAIKTGWKTNGHFISSFFRSLKPGDKFWTSPAKGFVFHKLERIGKEWVIFCVDQNGAPKQFKGFSYFNYKRLYGAQPRSFTKESAI